LLVRGATTATTDVIVVWSILHRCCKRNVFCYFRYWWKLSTNAFIVIKQTKKAKWRK